MYVMVDGVFIYGIYTGKEYIFPNVILDLILWEILNRRMFLLALCMQVKPVFYKTKVPDMEKHNDR